MSYYCSSPSCARLHALTDSDAYMDADREENPGPTKRRRVGREITNEENPQRVKSSSQFWFADGDLVLQVERRRFKIHMRYLKCSRIFCDMLDLPQPKGAETVEGCPVVHLSDSPDDWNFAIQWLYDRDTFRSMPHPIPFRVAQGVLRLSTKYEIPELRKASVQQLHVCWPTELEKMDANAFPNAAEAIALARECDVPTILPAAFYALSLARWGRNAEGGLSHQVLSSTDMRRLIVGRERLSSMNARILWNPLIIETPDGESVQFGACPTVCKSYLETFWRNKLIVKAESPYECWLLHELHVLQKEGYAPLESRLCQRCLSWHKNAVATRFLSLKTCLPRMFHLSTVEEVEY